VWAGGSRIKIPAETRDFYLLQSPEQALGPTQLPIQWVMEFLLRGEVVGA